MAFCSNKPSEPLRVQDMSYDEFCIAAFNKDVDELRSQSKDKIEDYKEKYEQALDNIKKIKAANKDNKSLVDFIEYKYPELKESNEEKNIKDLIDELKDSLRAAHCQNDVCRGGHEKRIALLEWGITWLEKQGELVNSLSKGLDNAHERIDGLIQKNNSLIEQLEKKQGEQPEKQGEQKPIDKVDSKFKIGDWINKDVDELRNQNKKQNGKL